MRSTAPLPGNGGGAVFVNKAMIKFFKKHWEVLSYLIFGVLTTLLNIVLYTLFNRLFGYTAANSWGNVLDNALCILFAYCTNRAFVFRSKTTGKAMAKEFGIFVTCRLGTMVLDTAIMLVLGNLLAAQGAALMDNMMQGLLSAVANWFGPDTAIQMAASYAGTPAGVTDGSAAIAVIGGADGPTAIFVTSRLAPELLGSIAVAAYSYMALVPVIQPPIMKALTTKKERTVVMKQLRTVSKTEKIIFPIMVTIIVSLIVPDAAVLVGMLMLGNLMKESGVVDRIQKTAGNELMNIITIFLALSVGCTTSANTFLNTRTLFIIVLGLIAFSFGTAAGVLCGKVMYKLTGGQVNPLIGSAGVSAVPMAARVSQKVGQSENPSNFLLMHAMGPNVAGVIGSAVAAGILINIFG